jgi:hypothetical protein
VQVFPLKGDRISAQGFNPGLGNSRRGAPKGHQIPRPSLIEAKPKGQVKFDSYVFWTRNAGSRGSVSLPRSWRTAMLNSQLALRQNICYFGEDRPLIPLPGPPVRTPRLPLAARTITLRGSLLRLLLEIDVLRTPLTSRGLSIETARYVVRALSRRPSCGPLRSRRFVARLPARWCGFLVSRCPSRLIALSPLTSALATLGVGLLVGRRLAGRSQVLCSAF